MIIYICTHECITTYKTMPEFGILIYARFTYYHSRVYNNNDRIMKYIIIFYQYESNGVWDA